MRRDSWLDQLAHELTAHGIDPGEVAAIVVEAEGHLAESGEPALVIFGTPARYAATLVAALEPRRIAPACGAIRLQAAGIAKRYGRRQVLDGVSLELRAGHATLLMGPNGSGKSTLLRTLCGMAAPDAGRVAVQGTIGYAPQSGGLLDHLRPAEHFVLFGRGRGLARAAAVEEGRRLAEQLGWNALAAPVAGALSGGLRQKLSVVLAALGDPDVLLLDEPYQGLDRDSVQRFWELLWSWRDAGGCALVASHAHDAVDRADAILELGSAAVVA